MLFLFRKYEKLEPVQEYKTTFEMKRRKYSFTVPGYRAKQGTGQKMKHHEHVLY